MTGVRKTTMLLVLIFGLSACSGGGGVPLDVGSSSDSSEPASSHPAAVELPAMVEEVLGPFHGDFDAMVEKREIRVLVTYKMTNFFLDGGTPRGITAEVYREPERESSSVNRAAIGKASRSSTPHFANEVWTKSSSAGQR